VKVRHSQPQLRRAERYADRPELTPQRTLSDAEAAHREYAGLRLIARALEGCDEARLGVVRGLAELPGVPGFVMEHVDHPTLRRVLTGRGRGRPQGAPDPRLDTEAWGRLGEWLRRFHGVDAGDSLPGRMTTRAELMKQVDLSRTFLVGAGAPAETVHRLALAATGALEHLFGAELPSAVGHGDFTTQNVFVGPGGRLTVFDPLPIWRVCVFEDLARLTMGVRLLGTQAISHGLLFDEARLEAWESRLASGYSSHPEALYQLRAYQAMLLLDRWGELVGKRPASGRLRQGVRAGRVRVVQRWYGREAQRLTGLLG
jgi:aminoglycoside phosphotransferase (APT) family kinase protein